MMKYVLVLGSLFLFGCSTPPKDIKGPDGTTHKLVQCNDIEDCYEEASQVCGKYKIVNTSSHANTSSDGSSSSYSKMLVKCEG